MRTEGKEERLDLYVRKWEIEKRENVKEEGKVKPLCLGKEAIIFV